MPVGRNLHIAIFRVNRDFRQVTAVARGGAIARVPHVKLTPATLINPRVSSVSNATGNAVDRRTGARNERGKSSEVNFSLDVENAWVAPLR
jgi:hypothetical protein